MKKIFTLVAICLTLALTTAFAETQKSEIGAVSTELQNHYDVLLTVGMPVYFAGGFTGEVIPDFVPAKVGDISDGFAGAVYHPPINIYS